MSASYHGEETTENFEKRKIHRFPVQLPITLGSNEDMSSICTNLSSDGVSVETSKKLHVSERIYVEIILTPGQSPLKMQGQVVWKKKIDVFDMKSKPLFEFGIRFIRPLNNPWKLPGNYDQPDTIYRGSAEEEFPDITPYRRY